MGATTYCIVDRHSLNLKPWSARTYVYAHADLAQKYYVGLQEIFVSRLCSQEENYFFLPCLWRQNPLGPKPCGGNYTDIEGTRLSSEISHTRTDLTT
jgi:hypothetical protein